MLVSHLGTKQSESTIVLHLGRIEDALVTPAWLHERLGLRISEQWAAAQWPSNEGVLEELYNMKRADWKGSIVQVHADGSVDQLEMPHSGSLTPAEQHDLLLAGELAYVEAFGAWRLPKMDFEVPFSGSLLGQMCGLAKNQAASCATLSAETFVFPTARLEELIARVDRLRVEVETRDARWAEQAVCLAAYRRVSNLLSLVERGWSQYDGAMREDRLADVEGFRAAIDEAHDDVVRSFAGEESAAADDVLEMLDDPELVLAADRLAFNPFGIDPDEADEFLTTIRYACEHLSRSSAADRLMRDHAWPAVKAACECTPYAFARIVAEVEDTDLRAEMLSGWPRTHQEVQASLGPPQAKGVVEVLAGAGVYYRDAMKIVGAALGPGVLLTLWDTVEGSSATRGRRLAGLLLRFAISTATPDASNSQLMIGRRLSVAKVLAEVGTLPDHGSDAALRARFDALQKLDLKEQFFRAPALQGLGIVIAVAILWSAVADDEKEGFRRTVVLGAAIADLADAALPVFLRYAQYKNVAEQTKAVGDVRIMAGGAAAMFGLLAATFALADKPRPSAALAFSAESMNLGAWVLELVGTNYTRRRTTILVARGIGYRIAASGLALAGSILGAVALAWSLLPPIVIPMQGIERVLRAYFEQMLGHGGAFDGWAAHLRRSLEGSKRAFATVFPAVRMPLRPGGYDVAGEPGVWKDDDPPTFHAAHSMGFTSAEVAALFAIPEEDVIKLGILSTWQGSARPKGLRP